MHTIHLWALALLFYGLFLRWYENWRGPLRREEIDEFMRRLESVPTSQPGEREIVRAFLEADDGREFLMLNLVRLSPEPVVDPSTGQPRPAREVLEGYMRPFVRALVRRGGHPAFTARPIGGFVDTWGIEPGPGWSLVGMMRYRSRRDLMELVTDPRFTAVHGFKHAAMPVTCSFPMGRIRLRTTPRAVVALVLALGAALGHLALLTAR